MRIFISVLSFVVAIIGLVNQIQIADRIQINIFTISEQAMDIFGYVITIGMIVAGILYLCGKKSRKRSVYAVILWALLAFSGFFMEPVYDSFLFLRPITCTICSILALFVFIPKKQH